MPVLTLQWCLLLTVRGCMCPHELWQQMLTRQLLAVLQTGDADHLPCCLQVSKSVWGSVQALKELEDYTTLPDDLVGSSKRWREWMELERPGGQTGPPTCTSRW